MNSNQGSPAATVSPEQQEMFYRLGSIFTPYATKRTLQLYPERQGTATFAHYTSAGAALEIIKSKRFWMRNAMCMTDYSEVHHGYAMLRRVLGDQNRQDDLTSALEACLPGQAQDVLRSVEMRLPQVERYTYIASVSEHASKEDDYGRLSMWRAFGTSADRVAIVLSIPWFSGAALALNLIFSPVAYFQETEVAQELAMVIDNIRNNAQFLREVDQKYVIASIFTMLMAAVTCVKHVAFSEEKEWRAIYEPAWYPGQFLMTRSIECINGVPQHVCQIPIDRRVSPTLADLDLSRIFKRLIIGPTEYATPMADAFMEALTNAGVTDAEHKVAISRIPLRT